MKKILILGERDNLKEELEITGFFEKVETAGSLDFKRLKGYDILIVDSKAISYDFYLNNILSIIKDVKSNYFISNDEDTYQTVNKTLSSYGIIVMPPLLTDKQISQKVCSLSVEGYSVKNNFVCFYGAGAGAGTTMISQAVSKVFAKHTDKSVIYISLDSNDSMNYFNISLNGSGLSNIKEKLFNNLLTPEELKESCIKNDRLYILTGESDLTKVRYYHPEHIENLIKLSGKVFDIVIVNAGSNISGMSIGALNSCDTRFLVTTQSLKYLNNFKKVFNSIFKRIGINSEDFLLIINKYIDHSDFYDEISVSKNYLMPLVSVVPLVDYFISFASENSGENLYEHDAKFKNSIKQLSMSLCNDLGIAFNDDEFTSKKSFFRRK